MSARQSLYGQSLVRSANALNLTIENDQHKNWKRDWYTPIKGVSTNSSTVTPSGTPTPFGEETPIQEKFGFQIKAWVIDTEYKPIVDGKEEDVLNLQKYSTTKEKNNGDLSDDAIRGAVGNEGSASGLGKPEDSQDATTEELKSEEQITEPEPKTADKTELVDKSSTLNQGTDATPKETLEEEQRDDDGDVIVK
ncbi:hypothetical protein WICMUC_001552 [Wickerhamomyces mucosus]|uniref:Uncharacterized protein n=1 Tax=Wickerhamomyces mucosus TaxID=1378264 RepID=A0A9P8PVT2_9ASCO|nr:hypothetical protein WICMUC_001552 [Wickerhamomyces mucosus]